MPVYMGVEANALSRPPGEYGRKPVYMGVEANALSRPPGEYGRKVKTQRNWRGPAQAVEHAL